jgi:hypothetical protein
MRVSKPEDLSILGTLNFDFAKPITIGHARSIFIVLGHNWDLGFRSQFGEFYRKTRVLFCMPRIILRWVLIIVIWSISSGAVLWEGFV